MTRETDDLRERLIREIAPTLTAARALAPNLGGRLAENIVDAVLSALPRLTEQEAKLLTVPAQMLDPHDRAIQASAREKLQAGAILPERVTDESELR